MRLKKLMGVFVVAMVLSLTLVGCGSKKLSLTSNDWVYANGGYTYHFDKDGTGTYAMGSGTPMKFTYTDNGTSVSIKYEGNTTEMTLDYRIEDGKLIIVDSFGSDTVYTKK